MRMMKYLAVAGLILAVTGTAGATGIPFTHAYNGPVTMHISSRDMGTLYPLASLPPPPGGPGVPMFVDGVANVNAIAGQALYAGAGAGTNEYYDTAGNKYTYSSGVWMDATGNTVGKPATLEDGWGIYTVDSITPVGQPGDFLWLPGVGGIDLVGMYYGGVDNAVQKLTSTQTEIQVQNVNYTFYSQAHNALFTLGSLGTQGRTAANMYTGITGGNLELQGIAVQGPTARINDLFGNVSVNSADFVSFFSPNSTLTGGTGTFSSYIDLTGGTSLVQWDTNGVGFGNDMSIQGSTATKDNATMPGNWLLSNSDPITANVVPEPLTMLGLFVGVSGLGGYIRRRTAR